MESLPIMENRIYTLEDVRKIPYTTNAYRRLSEPGIYYGTLYMKAEARNTKLRLFFTMRDGAKVLTPVFFFQQEDGLWDLDVGVEYRLTYEHSSVGDVYLTKAEALDEESAPSDASQESCHPPNKNGLDGA